MRRDASLAVRDDGSGAAFGGRRQYIIAAVVWNVVEHRPVAQHSYETGFILQVNE
jgi:hypothetical protein